ncbi:hypothetical protein GCWU000325_01927 [Alloprevotella tannerae ATCC 51259]|uniref:Uncharacterized protein n=1 Tax=Alloprevotella tannerae ATCC 51259 TaxID=626522 RepID=C9LI69_9BACT|nr:hypothetical protein GCWU000325_01927 [Alloprevotella tannerae ATCC 51259]
MKVLTLEVSLCSSVAFKQMARKSGNFNGMGRTQKIKIGKTTLHFPDFYR